LLKKVVDIVDLNNPCCFALQASSKLRLSRHISFLFLSPLPKGYRTYTEGIPSYKPYTLQKMKSYSKSELARAAGVCSDTFRRWLKTDQAFLQANGITPTTRLFPPKVVQYLCQKYCIDLPD
jgi:hypothetical protein